MELTTVDDAHPTRLFNEVEKERSLLAAEIMLNETPFFYSNGYNNIKPAKFRDRLIASHVRGDLIGSSLRFTVDILNKICNKILFILTFGYYIFMVRAIAIDDIGEIVFKIRYLKGAINSERIIEIPYAMEFLSQGNYKEVLEVGNVLNKRFDVHHKVIDQYEIGKNVLNIDIMNYQEDKKFDAVICISTLEHIGFDEEIREFGKSRAALEKMMTLLKPGGKLLVSVPLGYNPQTDELVRELQYKNHWQVLALQRISRLNLWETTEISTGIQKKYASKYKNANSIAIMRYTNDETSDPSGDAIKAH